MFYFVTKISWHNFFQVSNIFFRFSKNLRHGALRNLILEGSMFFVFSKSKKNITNLNFLRHLNFVNISIFDTFRRLLRDIVACFCMLSYKIMVPAFRWYKSTCCHFHFFKSPKHDFYNFLTVSDIFQKNARNLVKSYPNKLPNGSFFN